MLLEHICLTKSPKIDLKRSGIQIIWITKTQKEEIPILRFPLFNKF